MRVSSAGRPPKPRPGRLLSSSSWSYRCFPIRNRRLAAAAAALLLAPALVFPPVVLPSPLRATTVDIFPSKKSRVGNDDYYYDDDDEGRDLDLDLLLLPPSLRPGGRCARPVRLLHGGDPRDEGRRHRRRDGPNSEFDAEAWSEDLSRSFRRRRPLDIDLECVRSLVAEKVENSTELSSSSERWSLTDESICSHRFLFVTGTVNSGTSLAHYLLLSALDDDDDGDDDRDRGGDDNGGESSNGDGGGVSSNGGGGDGANSAAGGGEAARGGRRRRKVVASGFRNTAARRANDEGVWLQDVLPRGPPSGSACRSYREDTGSNATSPSTSTLPSSSSSLVLPPEWTRRRLDLPTARECLYAQWSRHWDLSRPILIEKSPLFASDAASHLLLRERIFPGVSAGIVLVRHPLYSCLGGDLKRYRRRGRSSKDGEGGGKVGEEVNRSDAHDDDDEWTEPLENILFDPDRVQSALEGWLGVHRRLRDDAMALKKAMRGRYRAIMFEDFFKDEEAAREEMREMTREFFPDAFDNVEADTSGEENKGQLEVQAGQAHPAEKRARRRRRRRRLGMRGSGLRPRVDPRLLFGWARTWEGLRTSDPDAYGRILPALREAEEEMRTFGYSLLNLTEVDPTRLEEALGGGGNREGSIARRPD